ncbi:predicted protein [Nematostella vectensis]|uniref:G-protein coupled receptors family 1 profile domain-containing protein n=1 Tax=Nematostella vectensis TaxID=45351 RepID=A7RWR8_NEMVE|nr:predicted protein [Nematostella vectensis]|eukprot:XP_001636080.1 predicted protein [Nematostella vectensis]
METRLSDSGYQWIVGYLSILFVFGLVANSTVLLVFAFSKSLQNTTDVLLISLSISDWLQAVLGKPVVIYGNVVGWWNADRALCVFYGLSTAALGFVSLLHLAALAFQRWLAITKPMTYKRIYPLVGTLWAWGMLWAVFPVLGWSGYELEPGETGCAITWNDQSTTNKSYIFIIFGIFFLLPITLVIGCYAWVAKLARNIDAAASQATLRSEKENAWTSFVMFLGFLIAWLPYAIVSLYSAITGERVSPEAATIPGMLAKSASCYNPLIYVFLYSR